MQKNEWPIKRKNTRRSNLWWNRGNERKSSQNRHFRIWRKKTRMNIFFLVGWRKRTKERDKRRWETYVASDELVDLWLLPLDFEEEVFPQKRVWEMWGESGALVILSRSSVLFSQPLLWGWEIAGEATVSSVVRREQSCKWITNGTIVEGSEILDPKSHLGVAEIGVLCTSLDSVPAIENKQRLEQRNQNKEKRRKEERDGRGNTTNSWSVVEELDGGDVLQRPL